MKSLYFIGIVIPGYPAKAIRQLKRDFSDRYQTRHGLDTLPHITLQPPFRETEDAIEDIARKLEDLAKSMLPFDVELDGFGALVNRVLFIKVGRQPALNKLYLNTIAICSRVVADTERPFHPHITIAHRDLTPDKFAKAWPEYKDRPFKASFKCKSISLIVQRDGFWVEARSNAFPGVAG
jgi:2'-5' RNA ligase